MDKLPALLPNVTPLESRFLAEISKKRQRCKMDFTIKDKALMINY
jgi:hypothetical protein